MFNTITPTILGLLLISGTAFFPALTYQPNPSDTAITTQADCNFECGDELEFIKAKVISREFQTTIPADTNSDWLKQPIATVNFRSKKGLVFVNFSAIVGNLDNKAVIQLRLDGEVLCGHVSGKYAAEGLRGVEVITYPAVQQNYQSISHHFYGELENNGKHTLEIFAAGCCSNNRSNMQLANPTVQIFNCR